MEKLSQDSLIKIATVAYQAQSELGDKMAGPDWKTKNLPFYRAIAREYAECFDHIPWEWWKKQNQMEFTATRRQQTMLELTDNLCFGMSDQIVRYKGMSFEGLARKWLMVLTTVIDTPLGPDEGLEPLRMSIETAIQNTLMLQAHHEVDLAMVYRNIGATPELIYAYYFGKNALNHFRQDNGDKIGKYSRTWAGVPDNAILAGIVEELIATTSGKDFEEMCLSGVIIDRIKEDLGNLYRNFSCNA